MKKILISSCLVGLNTRYNGKNKRNDQLAELAKSGHVVFVCPEQLGGLPTPREPSEIEPGKTAKDVLEGKAKVLTPSGAEQTKEIILGAQKTLQLCQEFGVEIAILKAKSPSCASAGMYDGTFTGEQVPGSGVVAELLKENGITVYTEDNYPKELLEI